MGDDPTDWNALLAAVRPHFEALVDTQREPWSRPVLRDDVLPANGVAAPPHAPDEGTSISALMGEIFDNVLDRGYCNGAHPQYFGYFHPRPLPAAVLGDSIASLLNQSPAAWRKGPASVQMEIETLSWLSNFIGYSDAGDQTPAGIFTLGGTAANLGALKMARDKVLGPEVQQRGIASADPATVYVSTEHHYSIARAMDILGIGRNSLRLIPTDREGRMSIDDLRKTVLLDRQNGFRPIAVIGLAGATATGSIDDLNAIAGICAEYKMWFHVDGAAAAVFADIPGHRDHFNGLKLADSVAIDPHKWMFIPYGLGCLLVRDPSHLGKSYADGAHYWQQDDRTDFVFMGPDGARPWKSLGLWLTMRQLGKEGYSKLLRSNFSVTQHLARRIKETHGLELLADPIIPVCCFRVKPLDPDTDIDEYNNMLHQYLMRSKNFYVTLCFPNGETYFRVAVNNYLSRNEHVDALLDAVEEARALHPIAAATAKAM